MPKHYNTFEEITTQLGMLTSGKRLERLPDGTPYRSNELGDLFELYIPMRMYGDRYQKSTKKQDIKDHIDAFIDGVPYDFKAPKRHGDEFPVGKILVEKTNVQGKTGWLYGEAKFLMFGFIDDDLRFYYLKYDREALANYVDTHDIKWEESRRDRSDSFAWIEPPIGINSGLRNVIDIDDLLDEELYKMRQAKFKRVQDLRKEHHHDD